MIRRRRLARARRSGTAETRRAVPPSRCRHRRPQSSRVAGRCSGMGRRGLARWTRLEPAAARHRRRRPAALCDGHRRPSAAAAVKRGTGMLERMHDDAAGSPQPAEPARRLRPCGSRSPIVVVPGQARQKRLSSTTVWVRSKVALCGSWTKSMETTVSSRLTARMFLKRLEPAAFAIGSLISSLGVPRRVEGEVDERDVRRRHADRDAVELALERRHDQAHAPCRASRGRDHGERRGARAMQVLVQRVDGVLVAGIGMDRRHVAALDAETLVQDIGDRRQAVGGAGAVRDHRCSRSAGRC